MFAKFAVAVLLFAAIDAGAVECPLGAKEDHLTIQRVMRNFGRFVSDADALAIQAQQIPESITDEQIKTASAKLTLALACAQAVLDQPESNRLPTHANELQGPERDQFIAKFLDFMRQFRDGLEQYRNITDALLTVAKPNRQFDELYQKYKTMDALVDKAHSELGGGDPQARP
jgi:hypothetical protein